MIDQLPEQELPAWLAQVIEAPRGFALAKLPIQEILASSVYYPACGLDGTPVKWLAGNFHSFVYADYLVKPAQVVADINGSLKRNGFKGYKPVLQRNIFPDEIVPLGWRPSIRPNQMFGQLINGWQSGAELLAHWSVWQRQPEYSDQHGPVAFSLFYVSGEMSIVYQALYFLNRIVPEVLAIIQPGSMGGEWEAAQEEGSFFHQVVRAHPRGMPDYLLNGGYGSAEQYQYACWREYQSNAIFHAGDRHVHLFRRTH